LECPKIEGLQASHVLFIRNVQLSIHSKYSKCLIFRIRKEKRGISNISSILKMGVFESKSRDQVSMKMPSHDKILLHMFWDISCYPCTYGWSYKPFPLESICLIPAIKSSHSDWYCTESSLFALFASVKSPVITTTSGLINFKVLEQKIWKSFVRRSSLWVEIWMSETWTKWTKLSSDSPLNVQHTITYKSRYGPAMWTYVPWIPDRNLIKNSYTVVNVPGNGAPPIFSWSNWASAPTWKIIRNSDNAPKTRKTVRTTHRWPKFSPKRAISDSFQTSLRPQFAQDEQYPFLNILFFLFWIEFFL